MAKEATFVAAHNNLRLVVEPRQKVLVGTEMVWKGGKTIEFKDGVYKTSDPAELKFLREHRLTVAGRLTEVTKSTSVEDAKEAHEPPVEPPLSGEEEGAEGPVVKKKTKRTSKKTSAKKSKK